MDSSNNNNNNNKDNTTTNNNDNMKKKGKIKYFSIVAKTRSKGNNVT